MKKTLFLDRDGVVNVDHGYTYEPDKFEFIDGVFEACHQFQAAGYEIVIITNQSGIGRGYYTEQDFQHLMKWMCEQFKQHNVRILDVFFCPHHPEKALPEYKLDCDCRKPKPGMLLQAIEKYDIDPKMSIMVGDKKSDMQAAVAAGIGQKYLVLSGQTLSEAELHSADTVFDSITELAEALL
jgi:D-glycero-D-manno-heptose 1,7-bisphosphate phosphatase